MPVTAPRTTVQTAKTIRMIHASLLTGVLLFAIVAHFLLRPTLSGGTALPSTLVSGLLGLCLVLFILALMLVKRVPRRSSDASPDLFWSTAVTPAMIVWSPLQAAGLIAVFLYAETGSSLGIAIAAVAIVLMAVLRPGHFERRR